MISVVIPLYNKECTIIGTLETVLAQKFTDFEVVIVDDGSTDNGVAVINKHFYGESRIRIVRQENQGVSVARNRGVEESNGEYISFLDGDDEWHPEYLQRVYDMISKYPDAGMYCTAGLVHNADGSMSYRVANKYIGKTLEIEYFESPDVFSHTSATTISKTTFQKSHKFPVGMKRSEDLSLFFEIALMSQVIYCGIPLSKYVGGVQGQATSSRYGINSHIAFLYNKFANEITLYKNRVALEFLRYNMRHRMKTYIIHYRGELAELYNAFSPEVISLFSKYEWNLFLRTRRASVLYINATKIVWRSKGYPILGEKIDRHKIDASYFSW